VNLIVPALRGVQGQRPYYACMVSVAEALTMFAPVDVGLPPEERAQRALSKGRVAPIADYVVKNPASYTFGALVGALDEDVEFAPSDVPVLRSDAQPRRPGFLRLTAPAHLLDGQHRRAGLAEAARRLGDAATGLLGEHLAVLLYPCTPLRQQQRMFTDLNGTPQLPNKSLTLLYGEDEATALAKAVVAAVPVFTALTDGEKTSISGKSPKLFAFKSLRAATEALASGAEGTPEALRALAVAYWTAVSAAVPGWQDVAGGKLEAAALRERCVHAHGVTLQALGLLGRGLIANHPDWLAKVQALASVPWSREASVWQGRCCAGNKMQISARAVMLTANVLRQHLGLALSVEGRAAEAALTGG
jgi:DNA sulfur modification protein DndB